MELIKVDRKSIYICQNRDDLSKTLAESLVELSNQSVQKGGRFTVALSGGSTPKSLYSLLAEPQFRDRIPWDKTHLFWGDERSVPHDSTESNYNMARQSLISRLSIPTENVHPTVGQDINPQKSADDYTQVLKKMFGLADRSFPKFDCILLGLGPDGHTASLFPGTEALADHKNLVVANYVEKFKSYRITFTLPVLNAARQVIFMVAGEDKKDILPQVLKSDPVVYPAQLIRPTEGQVSWYVDQAAAQNLDR